MKIYVIYLGLSEWEICFITDPFCRFNNVFRNGIIRLFFMSSACSVSFIIIPCTISGDMPLPDKGPLHSQLLPTTKVQLKSGLAEILLLTIWEIKICAHLMTVVRHWDVLSFAAKTYGTVEQFVVDLSSNLYNERKILSAMCLRSS